MPILDGCKAFPPLGGRTVSALGCLTENPRLIDTEGSHLPVEHISASTPAPSQSVLVGFAEAVSAPEVVWSLVDAGYQVTAFARRGRRSSLRHSKYVRIVEITPPELDCGAALSELGALLEVFCKSNDQRVLMPLDDAAVWLGSRIDLRAGWACAGPRMQLVDVALNKWAQVQAARSAGMNVPATILATTPQEVLNRADRLPLILKPSCAIWQRGNKLFGGRHRICANLEELRQSVSEWKGAYPVLVQPFIRGTGEGVFGLATSEGVKVWSAHRRIRMVNPQGSGSCACESIEMPAELRQPVETFVKEMCWRGIFMVELLRDHHGTSWFVEFNGRPWGSMALARRRGLEYPAWNVKVAMCPGWSRPEVAAKGIDHLVCRHAGREFMHLLFVLRGRRSGAFQEWPSFWRTLFDLLHIRKNEAFYNWRKDDKAVFLTDWLYTIRQGVFGRGVRQ